MLITFPDACALVHELIRAPFRARPAGRQTDPLPTPEGWIGLSLRNAPCPRAPWKVQPTAGADTTPTTGVPSANRPIDLAKMGKPWAKFVVPSSGYTCQVRPDRPARPPPSSPTMASSGNAALGARTITVSARLSNSVTSSTYSPAPPPQSTTVATSQLARWTPPKTQ
jgi:hypothetical protein